MVSTPLVVLPLIFHSGLGFQAAALLGQKGPSEPKRVELVDVLAVPVCEVGEQIRPAWVALQRAPQVAEELPVGDPRKVVGSSRALGLVVLLVGSAGQKSAAFQTLMDLGRTSVDFRFHRSADGEVQLRRTGAFRLSVGKTLRGQNGLVVFSRRSE